MQTLEQSYYDELKAAMQKLIFGGQMTPDLQAVLVRHGIIGVPDIDTRMVARCSENLRKLKEPMRDEELGILARKELPKISETLLNVIPVVRAAITWRSTLDKGPGTAPEKDLVARVDVFLEGSKKT